MFESKALRDSYQISFDNNNLAEDLVIMQTKLRDVFMDKNSYINRIPLMLQELDTDMYMQYLIGIPHPVNAFHPDNLKFSDFKKIAYDKCDNTVTFETVLTIDGFNRRSTNTPSAEEMKQREDSIVRVIIDVISKEPDIDINDIIVSSDSSIIYKININTNMINKETEQNYINVDESVINRPSHYSYSKSGRDLIDWCEDFSIMDNAYIFNIFKYLVRAGKKKNNSTLQDALKAREYLDRYIKILEKENNN